jgi:hypothetical protein
MSCQKCLRLCVRYRIDSPRDLRKTLRTALQNLEEGTLREVRSPRQADAPTILELAHGKAWSDVVSIGFECQTCGHGFRLMGEAYYGSGGYWDPD